MWDEKDGLYYDYNFARKEVRRYPFVTTFYPLWVGAADSRQAARIVANLKRFERPGGLLTSTNVSGNQWDAPFGWAPTEMIAIQGLRRYGYGKEADRLNVIGKIYERLIDDELRDSIGAVYTPDATMKFMVSLGHKSLGKFRDQYLEPVFIVG